MILFFINFGISICNIGLKIYEIQLYKIECDVEVKYIFTINITIQIVNILSQNYSLNMFNVGT